jgi:hypothetical protein
MRDIQNSEERPFFKLLIMSSDDLILTDTVPIVHYPQIILVVMYIEYERRRGKSKELSYLWMY